MGILDDPEVSQYASEVISSVGRAEASSEISFSPIAREIAALFLLAPTFEGPAVSADSLDFNPEGTGFTNFAQEQLPQLIQDLRDTYRLDTRRSYRRIITSADLYHYLGERLPNLLVSLAWPYPKDDGER